MSKIITFIFKWCLPIGFVKIVLKKKENIRSMDNVGNQVYWRISDVRPPLKGAEILIRKK